MHTATVNICCRVQQNKLGKGIFVIVKDSLSVAGSYTKMCIEFLAGEHEVILTGKTSILS